MAAVKKSERSTKTGRFTEWTPLSNPGFLQGVRTFVKASDDLLPVVLSLADQAEPESASWMYWRSVASMLGEMSSNLAGKLVAQGERLIVPPPSDFLRGGWNWGDPNDHDVLVQCESWYQSASGIQWFFAQLTVGKKPSKKVLDAAGKGDADAAFVVMTHMTCMAMDTLKTMLHERLSKADDKEYLKEAQKPALRLPMMAKAAP